jgi:hypothetical protein
MQSPGHGLKWEGIVESVALLGERCETPVRGSSYAKWTRLDVQVGVQELKSIEQLCEEWSGIDTDVLEERINRATRLRFGYESGALVLHWVWVWQWGEAICVAQPGEAYSHIQTELRRRYPDRIIFVMNLTSCPGPFYLPIRSAHVAPGYQAWQRLPAAGALDQVIDEADEYIASFATPTQGK